MLKQEKVRVLIQYQDVTHEAQISHLHRSIYKSWCVNFFKPSEAFYFVVSVDYVDLSSVEILMKCPCFVQWALKLVITFQRSAEICSLKSCWSFQVD